MTAVQCQLFEKNEVSTPPRPLVRSPNIINLVAEKLAHKMISLGFADKNDFKGIVDENIQALEYVDISDSGYLLTSGYHLTKFYEDSFCWEIDDEIVDFFSNDFGRILSSCYRDCVKEWARINDVKPTVEIGTDVSFFLNGFQDSLFKENKLMFRGKIFKVYEKDFQYVITVLNDPTSRQSYLNKNIVVNCENVKEDLNFAFKGLA